jgi:hypothetical protein
VVAALLLAMVAPIAIGANDRQAAQASAPQPGAVLRRLYQIIPQAGSTKVGRPAWPTTEQWWRLAKVACTTNEFHDNVHEYETTVDDLLSLTGIPNPYRYQSSVLELSRQIYEFKQQGGLVYEFETTLFCAKADRQVKRYVGTPSR